MRRSSLGAAVAALLSSRLVRAFIPAVAMNDTSGLIESADTIHMAWLPNGVFSAELSRQLVADPQDNSTAGAPTTVLLMSKFAKGVLLHFSEEQASELPSAVPWVAAINCDTNGTTFSLVDDIFTLARDHGAQAALLYTLTGQVCIINQDYLQNFEKPLDVYATRDRQSARLIEGRFNKTESNGGPTAVYTYNSAGINQSIASIKKLLALPSLSVVGDFEVTSIIAPATTFVSTLSSNTGTDLLATSTSSVDPSLSDSATNPSGGGSTPTSATAGRLGKRAPTSTSGAPSSSATSIAANYLGVVMASTNLTVGASAATPSASASGGGGGGGGGPNTGLAMIILYAITGVVTFMFLIVILSGAIRAIRHPERYGPRATMNRNGAGGRPPQSRAGGLTRAILDTFPVVKFGRSTEDQERDGADVEAAPKEVELDQMSGKDVVRESEMIEGGGIDTKSKEVIEERRKSGESSSAASSSTDPATSSSTDPATDRSQPTHRSVPTVTSIDPPPAAANINPADVDHGTTCPICVCEFEDGEDVRILPCDGRHRFHRDCIDPWLLQVSSLCPLCRLDLSGPKDVESAAPAEEEDAVGEERVISNLRAMLQGHSRNSTASTATGHARDSTVGTAISGNRFSRYVARRRAAVGGRPTTAGSDSEGIPAVAAPPSGS